MTVAELIEKLKTVDPALIVCVEDNEFGLDHDVTAHEITADVDRCGHGVWHVDTVPRRCEPRRPRNPERIVVLTRHGGHDETDQAREL